MAGRHYYNTRSHGSVSDDDDCESPPKSRRRNVALCCPKSKARTRKRIPSPCSTAASEEFCEGNKIEKYIKVFKIVLILVLLAVFMTYIFDHTYHAFRRELTVLKGHINSVDSYMNSAMIKKKEVDKQLAEIASSIPVIKQMANSLKEDLQLCKGSGAKGNALKRAVKDELEVYNADKTGKTDFALESSGDFPAKIRKDYYFERPKIPKCNREFTNSKYNPGGTILCTRDTQSFNTGSSLSLFGIPLCPSSNSPNALIQPGVMPGECWAFKGSQGTAVIKLINQIYVTGISLEHIPRSISPSGEISTAPKEFSVWGLRCKTDTDGFFFGQFKYNEGSTPVQYFPVLHKSSRTFDIIEFKVHSNYGHPEYTCVYRLRVHGNLKTNQWDI